MTAIAAIGVHRYLLRAQDDVRALVDDIRAGVIDPDHVYAVTGKTQGPGGTHDPSRGAIDAAVRRVVLELGTRTADEVAAISMNFSGGSAGVISPHIVVLTAAPTEAAAPGAEPRLTLASGVSAPVAIGDLGRSGMVAAVASAVRRLVTDSGLTPETVTYAMAKNPMITEEMFEAARAAGIDTIEPKGLESLFRTSGATALGVAVGLGDVETPDQDQIGVDHGVWSARVSASSGTESDRAQLLLLGNRSGAPGRYRVGRAVLKDALDVNALHRAARNAGLDVSDATPATCFADRIAALYVKCNATADGTLRGFPQVQPGGYMDIAYANELKGAVGGAFAGALGDPAFYISAAGIHQGPPGGGSVVVIADVGEVQS